jgi:hypothetical protein
MAASDSVASMVTVKTFPNLLYLVPSTTDLLRTASLTLHPLIPDLSSLAPQKARVNRRGGTSLQQMQRTEQRAAELLSVRLSIGAYSVSKPVPHSALGHATQTVFRLQNSRMPSMDSSRP